MRVLQLTRGQGNPQEWVQMCMLCVTYSITFSTVTVLLAPIFADNEIETDATTGEVKVDGASPFKNSALALIFTVMRYAAFFALYVGFAGVCAGVFMFEPPKELWSGPVTPVSPAVACTITLAIAFFGCYLLVAISRTYSMFTGGNRSESQFEKVMSMAANTMGMAPMLCVLFLGARMRALQMDPISGNPQRWAQNCFFMCTYALVFQTCVAIFVPLVLSKVTSAIEVKEVDNKVQGDLKLDAPGAPMLAQALTVLRFLVMLSLYAGAVAVVCSVFTIEHPDGAEHTIDISPTMQCVVNLSFQYFFVLMLVWMFQTIEDLTDYNFPAVRDAVESARATVEFAPMLSVLFIATRMRALQISDNKGSPQKWAQDG